jgi:hypothetical protein
MELPNPRQFTSLLGLCLLGLLTLTQTTSHVLAQTNVTDEFVEHHRQLIARNPEGLTFILKLKDSRTQFHVGEKIRLELSFSSSLPDTYAFDNATYDRSGRLEIDGFVVDPTDAVSDPLSDYYHKNLGHMMGGLRGIDALRTTSQLITYDLNEWLRFEKPGTYRLYVISHRVTKGEPNHSGNTPVAPVSNLVEFEIIPPNREWEQTTLAAAAKILDGRKKASYSVGESDRRSACRVLRFMGSEAAIREMISRFRGEDQECEFEYYLGLVGAPNHSSTIQQMEAALDAPTHPVSSTFLNALVFLSSAERNPDGWQQFQSDDAGQKAARAQWERWKANYDLIRQSYLERLALAVPQKAGAAAAISTETLISFGANDKSKDGDERRQQLAVLLAKVFTELPLDTQRNLLEYRWKQISDPAMLPVLRQLYEHPPDLHEIPAPFPGVALGRIYDLSPEEGRQLILDEIKRPIPRASIAVLGALPDKELPQLEAAIVEHMINFRGEYHAQETAAALVARYVSAASLPRLRAAFEDQIGTLGCTVQSSLISYFLRSNQNVGLEMLRKALATRKHTRCYGNVLLAAAGEEITPEFEALALEYLNDSDEEVMYSAVRVLCAYGSIDNEAKIKAAIKQLLDRWRAEKIDPDSGISKDNSVHVGYFAESLLRTYAHAIPWFISDDELNELGNLCLNEQCRQQVKSWSPGSKLRVSLYRRGGFSTETRFSVGVYELLSWKTLKKKLIQFPKGTSFVWQLNSDEGDADKKLFDDLKSYLKENGMDIVRHDSMN